MKRQFTGMVCALALAGASMAFAGAYGEAEVNEESPAAPAAAVEVTEEAAPTAYWYVGGAAVYSLENFDDGADNAWGYNLRAGRRINDMFAAELEFEHPVEDFQNLSGVDGNGVAGSDVEAWNLTANGRVYPITGRFQPYGLVGLGYGRAELPNDDNDGFIARFGLGLDILILDNFGIEAEAGYVVGSGSVSNYDQIPFSLGFFFNFG